MNQSVQVFRPAVAQVGMHRRVVSEREELSENFLRQLAVLVVSVVILVSGLSMFLHGQVNRELAVLDQVQSMRRELGNENIRLLANRAELASLAHVEKIASARLGLYLPADGQEIRLY
jgi:cell division protein FtsL